MMERFTERELQSLLGRPIERLLTAEDRRAFAGRRCLITGAGGSVGSELARQVVASGPALVTLVDHSEHALFRLEDELAHQAAGVSIEPVLCDVTRGSTIARVIHRVRPDIVFHAAAYKHVTIAERAICAAARVNVLGTTAVLGPTREVGAQFVLISSDKAAAPRSVMGATKRFAELATLASPGRRRPVVVRFGNVLGSSGSVVEVMGERIRAGRPLPVTDPDATRFFMTVSEAASLVMKASMLARGGETFWLDMGKQVRIGDLAERLLATAARRGLPPVPVDVIGLRAGEKLVEQLASQGVSLCRTSHSRILVAQQPAIHREACGDALRLLRRYVSRDDAAGVLRTLEAIVGDFEASDSAWATARAAQPIAVTRRVGSPSSLSAA